MEWLVDRFKRLKEAPQTLIFPQMTLFCGDREAPLIIAPGTITMDSLLRFDYSIKGVPADPSYTLRQLRRQKANLYKPLMRFRLVVKDEQDVEFTCGWTVPQFEHDRTTNEWRFSGECEGLMFDVQDLAPAQISGTEAQFIIPQDHRASQYLLRFVRSNSEGGKTVPEYQLTILGEHITFRYYASEGTLSVFIPESVKFPLTLTENWISEPLRILFGQLIYPRLVARIQKKRALMSLRRTFGWSDKSNWAAVWRGRDSINDRDGFWSVYGNLLAYIASAKDSSGHSNFEANKITQLYVEVIQASYGSRWVWALTFASSVEGLLRILIPRGSKLASVDHSAINSLAIHIQQWKGEERLIGTAIGAVRRMAELTPKRALQQLVAVGKVTDAQVQAWEEVRNAVMHGDLGSPYSTEKDDNRLLALSDLMHAVTLVILEQLQAPS